MDEKGSQSFRSLSDVSMSSCFKDICEAKGTSTWGRTTYIVKDTIHSDFIEGKILVSLLKAI